MNAATIHNNQALALSQIPNLDYEAFRLGNLALLDRPERHCVHFFGVARTDGVQLFCCVADDTTHEIQVSSTMVDPMVERDSLTAVNANFEPFEREIHERFGVRYSDHPWLKPFRYAFDRADQHSVMAGYPFLRSKSEELHEVGVGPIHAGIIEPGHFRFICNGEQIMHLEIQLGYQHRGIESLMVAKKKLLERTTLAENIAGDTTVGHTTAFVNLWESLCGHTTDTALHYARTVALELERMAIHTGDMAAVCADIGYQLGNAVYGRLRTPIINFFQEWCGNRLAKGLIRAGKINYPFTPVLAERLLQLLEAYEADFEEMTRTFFELPSALSRMEKTGVVTYEQVMEIGTVGMAARMSGLNRDIRASHPFNLYGSVIEHTPVIKHHGDVYARVRIRREEIRQSMGYLRQLMQEVPTLPQPLVATPNSGTRIHGCSEVNDLNPGASQFVLSLVEGWRGEICHAALTDAEGNLAAYSIKDPSNHNWMALAQAVRNNEISDFPICNKSFNLSYCGHDL